MKNFFRPSSALLASLCLAAAATPARATVVWTAGFEKNKSGDVCSSMAAGAEFTPGTNETNGTRINAQVLGEQVYAGSLACKVTVHPDDIYGQYKQDRVDIHHTSTLTGEGKDLYLSGHYYLSEDAKTRNEFAFFETAGPSYTNWIDIWIEPKTGGGTSIKLGIESNGADLGSVLLWTGDFVPAKWHQIAIHVHWSMDATKGLLDFWLDGQQVITAVKHKTKPNTADLFFQTGLHRVLTQPYTESIYFDDFLEADTQDEIKISAPMAGAGSTDGGTAISDAGADTLDAVGAGGATGSAGAGGGSGAAGPGGTGAAGTGSGAAGVTGAGSAGTAGVTATGAGGGPSTGVAGGAGTTDTGGAKSSGGCTVAGGEFGAGTAPALVVLGVAIAIRRTRRKR